MKSNLKYNDYNKQPRDITSIYDVLEKETYEIDSLEGIKFEEIYKDLLRN